MAVARATGIALAIVVAGCIAADAPTQSDGVGGLEVGDSWTVTMDFGEFESDEDERYVIEVTETIIGTGTRNGEPAYEIDVEMDLPPQEDRPGRVIHRTETLWVRVSDLAILERTAHREGAIAPDEEVGSDGYSFSDDSKTVFERPCGGLMARALEVGDEWTDTCRSSTVSFDWTSKHGNDWHNYTHEDNSTYRVEAQERVVVPAGTFMAYRVTSTSVSSGGTQSSATFWVAPDACARDPVKIVSEYENEEHSGRTVMELVKADC